MPAWSGLWNGVYGADHSLIGTTNAGRRIRRALRGVSSLKYKTLLRTFVTDDVGTTATKTHTRIVASDAGGVRQIETVTDVNRALTAADETAILKDVDGVHTPTFPTEKSGNSGGGKLGF